MAENGGGIVTTKHITHTPNATTIIERRVSGDSLAPEIVVCKAKPRPELATLFKQSWRRNEAGYRFLADR